jgi:hypothetical protein
MDEVDGRPGWWVPVDQFWRQSLLPATGAWNTVRLPDGTILKAVLLAGRQGWHDGNYIRLRRQPTEWFKPAKYFRGPEDLTGKPEAVEAERAKWRPSILRALLSELDPQAGGETIS